MNAYEELASHRFSPGRDYDKRSVETFRARVLNLVDELLNQVTQLQDEVADLRDRSRALPVEPASVASSAAPVVPTTWLEALAGAGDLPAAVDAPAVPVGAMAGALAAFPAPAVASWLAELDGADDRAAGDDGDDESDDSAGSTAELLLAAAGNAVAVQAAAMATRNGNHPIELAPSASTDTDTDTDTDTEAEPASPPDPVRTVRFSVPASGPLGVAAANAASDSARTAADERRALTITPGDDVLATAGTTGTTDLARLPIVLDDGLPADGPLPTPVRHWGGWMRDVAGA